MRNQTLPDLLADFSRLRILVVGDVMLDEYVWGEVRRISPEAPVPVVEIRQRTYTPGGAGNAAANVAALGGTAVLGGVVGQDHHGRQLEETLRRCRVGTEGLIVANDRPTTTKTRIVAHGQQLVRADLEQRLPLPDCLEDALLQCCGRCLHNVDGCIVSDYDKGLVSARLAQRFLSMARRAGKPVVVDPKGTNYAKYRGATVITPNVHEVQRALNHETNADADVVQMGRRLLDLLADTAWLITRGAQGMSLFRSGAAPVYVPTEARNVFDVTGAGDTVVGTLALALAADVPLEQAVELANRAAGLSVGKVGTATVTPEDLLAADAPRANRPESPTVAAVK